MADSKYVRSGQKFKDEQAAKAANATAGDKSYSTSAAGLGALAKRLKTRPTPQASPTAEPSPTPLEIRTSVDLGGTPKKPEF